MAGIKQKILTLWKALALPAKLALLALVLLLIFLIGRSCRNVDPKIAILEGEKIILKVQLLESEKTHEAQRKEWDKKTAELQGHIDSAYTEIARLDQTAEASSKEREGLEEELKLVQGDLGKENKILRELYGKVVAELDLSDKARTEDGKIIFNLKDQVAVERAAKLSFQKDYLDTKALLKVVEDQSRLKDVKILQLKAKNALSFGGNVALVAAAAYLILKK
jgi:hypothetical protein